MTSCTKHHAAVPTATPVSGKDLMEEARQRRIAANEARFREANEHIVDGIDVILGDEARSADFSIMCECGVPECKDMLDIARPEYEYVRSHGAWFAVHPGHFIPSVEVVLDEHETYWIVEKIEAGKVVAEQLDPRASD